MSPKIAMIGAGSVVFCKLLMADIMATAPDNEPESRPLQTVFHLP